MSGMFICKESFDVDGYDDDGFSTEKTITVKKGDKYSVEEGAFRLIDGAVRLDNDHSWLEISKSTFERYFVACKEGE